MGADGGTSRGAKPPEFSDIGRYLTPAFFREAGVAVLKGLDEKVVDPGDIFLDADPPDRRLEMMTRREALERVWDRSRTKIHWVYATQEDFIRDVVRHWGVVSVERWQGARATPRGVRDSNPEASRQQAFDRAESWFYATCDVGRQLEVSDAAYICSFADLLRSWREGATDQAEGRENR